VPHAYGLSVDGSETVPEAGRDRQRPDQVDMHMRETCRREIETPKRGLHLPRYLGPLVGCTRARPCRAVFTHSRPHRPLGHQLDGGVGPGVVKAVEGVKDLASERRGYNWPPSWIECCCCLIADLGFIPLIFWHPSTASVVLCNCGLVSGTVVDGLCPL